MPFVRDMSATILEIQFFTLSTKLLQTLCSTTAAVADYSQPPFAVRVQIVQGFPVSLLVLILPRWRVRGESANNSFLKSKILPLSSSSHYLQLPDRCTTFTTCPILHILRLLYCHSLLPPCQKNKPSRTPLHSPPRSSPSVSSLEPPVARMVQPPGAPNSSN